MAPIDDIVWHLRILPYIKSRETKEIIKLEVPADKRNETFELLYKEGWEIVYSGPYSNEKMFPKIDPNRQLIEAERKL
jgi:hypothetical protein